MPPRLARVSIELVTSAVFILKVEPGCAAFVVEQPWRDDPASAAVYLWPFQNIDLGRIGDILDLENNLKTFSFTPGLEFFIPMSASWELRPYAHYGFGTQMGGEDRSQIYYIGINSRLELPSWGDLRILMINGLQSYGHNPDNGRTDRFWRLVTGFEGSYKLGDWNISGRQVFFKPHVAHYWYFNGIDFDRLLRPPIEIQQEFEIGFALGFEERISLKLFGFDRAGIAIRRGGSLDGIRFYISSIFQ